MAELDTEHVRMLDAGRQRVKYSSPLTSSSFASVVSKKTQLLQHGNAFGLSFVATEKGFVMAKNDALEASCTDYTKRRQEAVDHGQKLTLEEIHELPATKEVQLPSIAYWIALSPDEFTLAVAYGDSIALFEVAHVVEAATPAPFHTFSKLQAQEIAWCRDPLSERFAVLTLEKQVVVCTLEGSRDAINTETDPSSIAWSPSGEHIAVGLVDGTIAIYARESLQFIRSIAQPESSAEQQLEAHHVNWAEEELILAGYHKYDEENEETSALACIFDNGECVELDEVVGFFDVEGRRHQYFSVFLPDWRMFFITCSLSADIELLVSDPDGGEWQLWKPLEKYQARLPMNAEDEESFPMGFAINLNSTTPVPVDEDTFPPVPIVSCTNTEGLLVNFAFVDTTVNEVEFVKSPSPFDKKPTRAVVVTSSETAEIKAEVPVPESPNKSTSHEYGQNDENEFAESDGESSDEEEERKEEEDKARCTFRTIASDGDDFIASELFPKLFKAMGSTYDEEEHASTVASLEKDGKIFENDFVAWYVNWIFGDDESDSDEDEDAPASSEAKPAEMKSKEEIAAAFSKFTAKEGSWKCAVCMVNNGPDAMKCSACETPNPAAPKVVVPVTAASQLWKLIIDFDKSLQRVNESSKNISSKDAEYSKKFLSQMDKLRAQISSLCDEINNLDESRDQIEKDVLFVIGSDGDVHEQLEYGREILDSFNDEGLKRTLEEQPLDQRSKETWDSLKNKLSEVEKCCVELDSHLSSSKIGVDATGAVSSAHLFRVLKQTYDNSKMQYNKACKLAEQLEKLSLRGDHMRQTNGVRGISGEAEAHTAATKAEMVQMIVETEQRSQDVRRNFLALCNNVITPRDVFSTPRRKLAPPTPSKSSNSPLRVKACSKLMPKTQLSVASPMSTAKQSSQSVSFKETPVKSGSKLFSLAEAMAPKEEPAKLVQTPQPAKPSVGVGKAPQRPSLGAPAAETKPTATAAKPKKGTSAFGAPVAKEEENKTTSTASFGGFGVNSPAVKRKAETNPAPAFSLGGKEAPASSAFSFGSKEKSPAQPATTSSTNYKALLEAFYKVHNPSKTGSVIDKALATYKGREEDLFTRLFTMYVPDSTPEDVKKYLNGGPVPPKSDTVAASKSPAPTSTAAKSPFGGFGASTSTPNSAAKPSPFGASPSAFSLGPAANTSSGFGGFGSTATNASTTTTTTPSPFGQPAVDYRQKLVEFYQKHNPDKLSSVDATLQKYKGNEEKLFQNLALKYKVNASPAVQPANPATASPFGKPGAFSAPSTSTGASFGSTSSVGFGAAKPAPSASPFGAAAAPASSPFGATSQTSTGFGSGASGFGGFQSTATTPAFGTPSAFGTTGGFGAAGVNYREKLTAFYQQHNPAKLSSVDATLEKYKGREDHLFAMLEQKYVKKTPTAATGGFGIPSTTAFGGGSGFGAPSALGATAAPAFGSASTLGGTAQPAFGGAAGSGFGMASRMGGGFGSAAPAAPSGTTTGSGFSAFGSQTPSFGGAAQQSGGFGAAGSGGLGSGFGGAATGGFGQPAAFSSSSFTQMR
ncbi:hypothetical protein PPTG_21078 [Phytophthora nicotianae INRA-310]|uniref:RanBP2-type domain-containing protein n=1 Tax=Phytophthora nicotianae (strain INRA-310) TaxID=761204 RepID=W2RA10_PHYN3|nr:hypothetical protein PPTG_21078 [Phytophthora nicotianae INRA-310]ETN21355.1 hypothetical protein PPTG_21078 [Phytophthora nicotianae INRA-310]